MAAVTSFYNHAGGDGDGNDVRANIVADGKRKLEEGDEALPVVKKAAADTSHEQALSWNELPIAILKMDCCAVTPSPPPMPSNIPEDDTGLSSYVALSEPCLPTNQMTWLEEYKPVAAMVAVQCIYAVMAISAKAAFTLGISPMVFVVYRQAIATAALIPTSILSRRGSIAHMSLGCRGFCLVFIAALVGATLNQYLYYQGLKMASSSTATAMTNLVPAITFLMAVLIGLEQVEVRSWRSMAKVIGTIICVVGAISMGFFKGPKLFRMKLPTLTAFLNSFSEKWVIGCFFLMGSTCCWSFWLIIQVPICKKFLDPLSLSTWMCFLSTFQSALVTYFIEPDLRAWRITSVFVLLCCLFVGIFGSGVTFFLQSWSITIKGPLFSALFTPLSTVITTILSFLLLGEELHIGRGAGPLTSHKNNIRNITKEVMTITTLVKIPVIFYEDKGLPEVTNPYHDAVVIQVVTHFINIHRVLIDGGSSVNILFHHLLSKLKIDQKNLRFAEGDLMGFAGDRKVSEDMITLPVAEGA